MPPTPSGNANNTSAPPNISLTHDDLSYTSASLPTPTMRLLISHLRHTNSLAELNEVLNDSLARTGWTDRVRALALELLRSGQCTTFPDLMAEVLARARRGWPTVGESVEHGQQQQKSKDKDKERNGGAKGGKTVNGSEAGGGGETNKKKGGNSAVNGSTGGGGGGHSSQNSISAVPGNGAISVRDGWFGPDGLPDVRIPLTTVGDGVDFLKGKVAEVVEVVLDDDDDDD